MTDSDFAAEILKGIVEQSHTQSRIEHSFTFPDKRYFCRLYIPESSQVLRQSGTSDGQPLWLLTFPHQLAVGDNLLVVDWTCPSFQPLTVCEVQPNVVNGNWSFRTAPTE